MRFSLLTRFGLIFLLGIGMSAVKGNAQAVSGNIDGTATDSSGAAVPAASVSIRDMDRGTEFRTTTNNEGNYSQIHLLAGHYEVKVEHEGFSAFVADVTVQVDATTRVEATLKPAGTQSTVTVTDEIPLLMTDRAEVSTTLTSTEVENLPVLDGM